MKKLGYIGVRKTGKISPLTGNSTYEAKITVNGHCYYLGTYLHDWVAARAYDRAIYFTRQFITRKRIHRGGAFDHESERKDNEMLLGAPGMCFYTEEERAMLDHLMQTTGLENDL